jgi:hypothetical protein
MPAKSPRVSVRRFSSSRIFSLLIASCLWIVPALLLGPAAGALAADTYTVTVLTDDYGAGSGLNGTPGNCPANGLGTNCSLRDAMTAANSDPGSDVVFQTGLSGRIPVSFVLPEIVANMTVDGGSAITLDGQNGTTPFAVYNPQTATPINVTIQNLTLMNGNGQSLAATGGIQNQYSNLTVNNVDFVNVTAGSSGYGGAIYNNGTLAVNNSTFINCTANNGGAIYNDTGGNLTVDGSTFNKLYATQSASIFQYSTTLLVVTNSTFTGNTAIYGAGIYSINNANLIVTDSTFYGNSAEDGGGVSYTGTTGTVVTLENNFFAENNECYADPGAPLCPTNGQNGNYVGPSSSTTLAAVGLLPLSNYGGLAPTLLPMPGSPGICAGLASYIPAGVTTDQRGFPINTSCVDAGAVQTNYITVASGADDASGIAANCPGAACTLRDAVAAANAAGYGDIDFANGLASIALASEGPTAGANVNIVGPGAGSLTVSGQSSNVILETSGGSDSLFGMTFAGGNNTGNGTGGAIDNLANLTLNGMAFIGNSAATSGGAIYNGGSGSLTVFDSTFANNTAPDGSAIYDNSATGGLLMKYSTFAGNTASADGAIYSGSGAAVSVFNSTLAGNTGGGIVIGGGSTLTVENSLLGESGECSGSAACPTTGTLGNVVSPANETAGMPALSALGSYSGTNALFSTPTILPEPGSSAICAGSSALIPSGVNTDQRGFLNENYTYPGYPYTAPCFDAGAVQTSYTSAQFVGAPYTSAANAPGATPPVIVSVTENGQNIGGVPVTLSFTGTGTASGLTATTAEGTGATFSSLMVTQASGASPDTLSTTIPVVGTYSLAAGPANLTVSAGKVTPTISVWPTASSIVAGETLSYSSLSVGTASVSGTFAFTSPSLAPGAGTTLQSVTFTPTDTADYNSVVSTVIVAVNPYALTWSSPAPITYGTALGTTQLNATAPVAGTFVYSPAAGAVLGAGSQTLSVTFKPTNTSIFSALSTSVALTVSQATPTISWTTPPAIASGTALSSTQLGATASVTGTFAYSPAAGTILAAGSNILSVTFTPTDSTDYKTVTATVSLQVNQATAPSISWATPAAITYGTALSSTQLDATGSVAGTLTYSPAVGTILTVGSQKLTVTLTPTNKSYPTVTASVYLTVNQAASSVTWATPAAIAYGTALSSTQLDAKSGVAGTLTYSPAAGTVLTAGSQKLTVTFSPTDKTDYTTATSTVYLTVSQAVPTITWANPAAISYPTALSATQLDAKASVSGTFTYSPAAGTVLSPGTQTLSVTFKPSDTVDYTSPAATVKLVVNGSTVTMGVSSGTQVYQTWTNFVMGPTYTGSRVPTGTVTLYDNGAAVVTVPLLSNGLAYWTTQAPFNAGINNLTVTYSGDAHFPGGTSAVVTITVLPAPVNFQASCWGAYSPTTAYQCTTNVSASTTTVPGGHITYSLDGGAPVSVPIVNGNAPFSIPGTFKAGTHKLTLNYPAQGNFAAGGPLVETFTIQ